MVAVYHGFHARAGMWYHCGMKHITSLVAFVLSLSLALLVGCGGGDAGDPSTITLPATAIRADVAVIDCIGRDTCGILPITVERCIDNDAYDFCIYHPDLCGIQHELEAQAYYGCLDALEARNCPQIEDAAIPDACLVPALNAVYQILIRD